MNAHIRLVFAACLVVLTASVAWMTFSPQPQPSWLHTPLPTCELTALDDSTWHGTAAEYPDGRIVPLQTVPESDLTKVRFVTLAQARLP